MTAMWKIKGSAPQANFFMQLNFRAGDGEEKGLIGDNTGQLANHILKTCNLAFLISEKPLEYNRIGKKNQYLSLHIL